MRIVILHGKHGDSYFKADTKEQEAKSLATIFSMHKEMGYYYNLEDKDFTEQKVLDEKKIAELESMNLEAVPEALKYAAEDAKRRLPQAKRFLADLIKQKAAYDKALAGDAAYIKYLLQTRNDYEYERISYEDVR